MTFRPQTGTQITGDELKKFESIRSEVGKSATPKQKESFIMRAANTITDFVGTRGIADQFGASLARTGLRLTGNKEAADLVENPDPSKVYGSALQSASMLIPGGVGRSLLTKVGLGATAGQLSGVGADLQAGKTASEAFQPQGEAVLGGAIPLVGGAIRGFSNLVAKTGDKIQFSVIKPSQADMADGFNIETIKKYDLGGSLKSAFSKTESKLKTLSDELTNKLSNATEKVDLNQVFKSTVDDLMADKAKTFGSNSQIGGILDDLREEIIAVSEDGAVDVLNANTLKRAAGHFGAWQYGVNDPTSNAREKVYNAFYQKLKTAIEDASPEGVKEVNKQMSEIIPVMNALIRRIPVAERNNVLSLGDIITLTGATVNPSAGILTLAGLASRSGTFGSAMSKLGQKGSNLEGGIGTQAMSRIGVNATNPTEESEQVQTSQGQ